MAYYALRGHRKVNLEEKLRQVHNPRQYIDQISRISREIGLHRLCERLQFMRSRQSRNVPLEKPEELAYGFIGQLTG
jgi:hypothetical protein